MGIQVTVTFEFPDIDDPDGEQASQAVERITEKTKEWKSQTWHDSQTQCTVWVDEAQAAPHLHASDESRSYGPRY